MSYIGVSPFTNTVRTVTRITANGSVSVFYPDGGYTKGYVDVFVAGEKKVDGVDFVATDSLQIGFIAAPANNSIIEIVAYRPVSLNVIDWGGVNNKPDPQITLSGDASGNVILNDLTSNTLSLTLANTTVVANAYGNSSQIPVITVDSKGRITNATTTAVAGVTGFAYEGSNNTFSITTGDGSTFKANISANSIAALALGSTGVVANAYGNSTAIPVITIDEDGRISNATTTSVSGVTGVSYAPANSTITVSTSTTDYNAVVNSGNSSVQGLLKVVDSVSNSSATITASANSVKVAYELAGNAVSNATSYAATAYSNAVTTASSDATTKAGTAYSNAVSVAASDATSKSDTAYSNAVSQATTLAGTAYSNAVSTASSDATTKANTAYSNAVSTAASDATSKSDTAYSNAVSQATTLAGTAYSNAVSQATTLAGTAYSNAVSTAASDATSKAGTAYSNAVSQATTLAGTAYSNAVSQATTLAGTAYSNAVSQATTLAGTAYSNATTFAANADNISSGTLSGARVQANNGIVGNTSGVFVKAGTGITVNTTGVHTNQDISNTANVTFGYMTITGNLVVQGTTTTVNTVTLSVQDNMIYLNSNNTVTNPDLGFAGNYNDGTYHHAGFFRDSTDSRWKVFDNYLPEPDASPYIDTSNTSFQLANFQANVVYANLTGDVTGNVSGSANSATYLGGNTAGVLRSYSDTVAGTAYSNAVSVAASDATTKAGTAYSNATSYAATIASTAYSNAVSTAASDATTKAGTAYSNATSYASNASNISSGTLSGARLPQANTTSNGAVIFLDSVSNTSTSIYAPTMNAVKTAYDLAGNAVSNATSYAATAYSNAVSTAATDATTKAGTAYSNAVSYADTKAGTAYSNATSYAATIAGTAYSNAVSVASSDATSKAATAYSNATSYAATIAGTAYSNATSYAATIAGTAYSNAVAYAASNSYVNSTFLPLAGGTMTGSIANGTFTTQLTVAGRTRVYAAGIADLSGTGNDIGLAFGSGVIFPTDGALNLTNNTKALGNSSYAFSSINLGTAAYAPIFYDADNTGYYGNFASTSQLNEATFAGYIGIGGVAPAANMSGTTGISIYNANYPAVGFSTAAGPNYLIYRQGSGGPLTVWNSTNSETVFFYSAYTRFTGNVQAPVFYDSADTSYYVDPAGGANLYANTTSFVINGGSASSAGPVITSSSTDGPKLSIKNTSSGGKDLWWISNGSGNADGAGKLQLWNNTDSYTALTFSSTSGGNHALYSAYTSMAGSARAPLFYDTDNTSYYIDATSTSVINAMNSYGDINNYQAIGAADDVRQGIVAYDSTAMAANVGGQIVLGYKYTAAGTYTQGAIIKMYKLNGTDGDYSSGLKFQVRDTGEALATRVWITPSGALISDYDMRAPIYYDNDNTGYYTNPASTSVMSNISQVGVYGRANPGAGWLSGNYSSVETTSTSGAIYSIGGSYVPGTTTLGNMYGIGYSYSGYAMGNPGGTPSSLWGMYVADNGTARIFLDGTNGRGYFAGLVQSQTDVRAPLFYDYNDTGYYCDPASSSRLSYLGVGNVTPDIPLSVNGTAQISSYLFMGGTAGSAGSWGSRDYTTSGIRYINALSYEFNNYGYGSTYTFLINASLAQHSASMRAPIFYDSDNTAYYVDPASTTVLNALNAVTKSFLINHPTKPGKKLRYACLEGPENGVYVRGKLTNENTIELPEYWTKLVDPDSISVSLTPIGKGQKLSVLDISNNQVVIEEEDSKHINCFYVVYGERVDVDKLEVEI